MAKKPTKTGTHRKLSAKRPTTKQDAVLALLRRANGASIDEITAVTNWQPHSARGFLSGAVKKRLGIDVVSERGEDGVRRYYVAPLKR